MPVSLFGCHGISKGTIHFYKGVRLHRISCKEELFESAGQTAEKIACFDPVAVRYAKQAFTRGMGMTIGHGLDPENSLSRNLRKKISEKRNDK